MRTASRQVRRHSITLHSLLSFPIIVVTILHTCWVSSFNKKISSQVEVLLILCTLVQPYERQLNLWMTRIATELVFASSESLGQKICVLASYLEIVVRSIVLSMCKRPFDQMARVVTVLKV
jgi:hypothetical protein